MLAHSRARAARRPRDPRRRARVLAGAASARTSTSSSAGSRSASRGAAAPRAPRALARQLARPRGASRPAPHEPRLRVGLSYPEDRYGISRYADAAPLIAVGLAGAAARAAAPDRPLARPRGRRRPPSSTTPARHAPRRSSAATRLGAAVWAWTVNDPTEAARWRIGAPTLSSPTTRESSGDEPHETPLDPSSRHSPFLVCAPRARAGAPPGAATIPEGVVDRHGAGRRADARGGAEYVRAEFALPLVLGYGRTSSRPPRVARDARHPARGRPGARRAAEHDGAAAGHRQQARGPHVRRRDRGSLRAQADRRAALPAQAEAVDRAEKAGPRDRPRRRRARRSSPR